MLLFIKFYDNLWLAIGLYMVFTYYVQVELLQFDAQFTLYLQNGIRNSQPTAYAA